MLPPHVHSVFLFFFDSINAAIFAQWQTWSLLFLFISCQVIVDSSRSLQAFYIPIVLLLLQDFMRYGRVGLALLWIIPLIGAIYWAKKFFFNKLVLLPFLLTAGCIFFDGFVVKPLVGIEQATFVVTICKICYTWICGIIIFLGLWGNRCLSNIRR